MVQPPLAIPPATTAQLSQISEDMNDDHEEFDRSLTPKLHNIPLGKPPHNPVSFSSSDEQPFEDRGSSVEVDLSRKLPDPLKAKLKVDERASVGSDKNQIEEEKQIHQHHMHMNISDEGSSIDSQKPHAD